jgi:polar amino acid transport system substrate-binding protein
VISTRARSAAMLACAALLGATAGCAAVPGPHTAATTTAAARDDAARSSGAGVGGRAGARAAAATACNPAASSLAPLGGPPQVTSGSFMAKIRARGYLIAGVDQNTYHFGYLNPIDGQIEGFDIDMIRAVEKAIFGTTDNAHIHFRAISDLQRIPDVENGSVDIVAHTMTITCDRLKKVDFSSVYFNAHQRVLVLKNSAATGLASLGGRKVCATAGSDSATKIASYPVSPKPILAPVVFWTDCLVLLQQGQVAAISTDDTILQGFVAQDPFTKVVGPPLTNEPYGLAIARQHPDFVRFVNAVLAAERADGAWGASYARWVGTPVPAPPQAQYAR